MTLLFQVVNLRYLRYSTNLTTNVRIADCTTASGNATLAAAMLDRLLHRATAVVSTARPTGCAPTKRHADTIRAAARGAA